MAQLQHYGLYLGTLGPLSLVKVVKVVVYQVIIIHGCPQGL